MELPLSQPQLTRLERVRLPHFSVPRGFNHANFNPVTYFITALTQFSALAPCAASAVSYAVEAVSSPHAIATLFSM